VSKKRRGINWNQEDKIWVLNNTPSITKWNIKQYYDEYCKLFNTGVSYKTFRNYLWAARKKYNNQSDESSTYKDTGSRVSQEVDGSDVRLVSQSYEIRTLNELLEYCKVDTSKYYVAKYTVNTWGNKDYPLFQVKAELKERAIPKTEDALADFVEQAKAYAPKYDRFPMDNHEGENLLEIAIPDLHYGKLSHAMETGDAEYNIEIAEKIYRYAVQELLDRAQRGYSVDRIVFLAGSDFFNVNDSSNATFSGTPQDEDMGWMYTFRRGQRLCTSIIDYLMTHCPVDVVVVRGNHDEERAYYLGEVLRAHYSNTERITVDNSGLTRKYYRWGKNLIGFVHGDGEKAEQLPLLMAEEAKDDWAQTTYREFHGGHFHHSSTKAFQQEIEITGVRVMVLPSLSAPDIWHTKKGYKPIREAQAFIWDKEYGKRAAYYVHPDEIYNY